jgi:hypothetical protein
MKVELVTGSDKFNEEHDYRGYFKVIVDGVTRMCFLDGEPEDANLARDFSGVFSVGSLILEANEAGLNGKSIEIINREVDDFE